MSLRTWRNGESAGVIHQIIEYNFKVTGKYLPYHLLCLSTENRKLLLNDYLSEGLIIFDTTTEEWLQYKNNKWVPYLFNNNRYVYTFTKDEWVNNEIHISFSVHKKENPIVQLLIKEGSDIYSSVVGGVYVDDSHNVTLSSDLSFDGKVVIK